MRDGVNVLEQPRYLDTLSHDMKDGDFKGHSIARNGFHFESTKHNFLTAVIENLKKIITETEIIPLFSVFGMKPIQLLGERELKTWGDSEIEKITAFYCKTQTHTGDDKELHASEPFLKCSKATLVNQWQRCKGIVKANC